jgi:predicted DsbA family dithiol-disulfide isomerase
MREYEARLSFSLFRIPFQLEPEYPEDEVFEETNLERMHRKWGGEAAFNRQKVRHRLKERGKEVGIARFVPERIASSTMKSHRLVQWIAIRYGLDASETLYHELNRRHFEQGAKLNSTQLLLECVSTALPRKEAGPSEEETLEFLQGDAGRVEISRVLEMLDEYGINSIPTVLIGGRHMGSGAQHADAYREIFKGIANGDEDIEGWHQTVFAQHLGYRP